MASSNDSFLMDVVDLKYWNILHRNNNKVEVINKEQHPDMFDRFEMTGLNNFDLFSSDFIARHINSSWSAIQKSSSIHDMAKVSAEAASKVRTNLAEYLEKGIVK